MLASPNGVIADWFHWVDNEFCKNRHYVQENALYYAMGFHREQRHFTPQEDSIIKENFGVIPILELCAMVGHPPTSVRSRAYEYLGIKSKYRNKPAPKEKQCTKCKLVKHLDDFAATSNGRRLGKKRSSCRACDRKATRDYLATARGKQTVHEWERDRKISEPLLYRAQDMRFNMLNQKRKKGIPLDSS